MFDIMLTIAWISEQGLWNGSRLKVQHQILAVFHST